MRHRSFGTATTVVLALLLVAAPVHAAEGSRFRQAVRGTTGVVATVSPLASSAALDVLAQGGNAVDAAAAAVFAVGVVRPEMCGIGGGGFLVYRGAGGEVAALDFREAAPAAHAHSAGVAEAGPFFQNGTGHNRVGVPGTVAGLSAAVRRYGTLPLRDVVAPAERLARDGFPVSRDLALYLRIHADRLKLYPESARTFLIGGRLPYPEGSTLVLRDYADALALIMRDGPKAFYRGPIAHALVADMDQPGVDYAGDAGFLTMDDLKHYRAIWREPLAGTYRGREIVAMPPPTSGGLAIVETLNILEGLDVAGFGQSSADHLHYLAEAQKIAWADRNAYVADPAFADIPVEMMSSKAYAAARGAEIDRFSAKDSYPAGRSSSSPPEDRGGTAEGGQTTHVSVIDAAGSAVAVTCSVELPFGSAVVAPGTGFPLNGQLGDFGAAPNDAAGGKRPRSSMSPTIVVDDGRPVLVLGAMGGPTIPLAVVQTIVNTVDFGLDLAHAVDAERADAQQCPDVGAPPRTLCLEYARVRPDVQADLTARGHTLGYPFCATHVASGGNPRCDAEYHPYPEVQAAGVDATTGDRLAVSDPRGEWGAAAAGDTSSAAALPTFGRAGATKSVRGGAPPPTLRHLVAPT
jgi:gamma-glutamyltranspeptidase/glutathione hydrolase